MTKPTEEMVEKLSLVDPVILLKALTASLQAKPNFCINCGYNDSMDSVALRDGFSIDLDAGVTTYEGRVLKITPAQRQILYALARSRGGRLNIYMLLERCSPRAANAKTVRTHLMNLRRSLESQGAPVPFKNESGIGYYWSL